MNSDSLIEVTNLSKVFTERGRLINALTDVSFKLPMEPMVLAILGESGAGKSTLARIVLGLTEPTSGDVKYKGISIREWLKRDSFTFRREVQPIFQDPYAVYNPSYRVDRVLELAVKKFKITKDRRETRELINNVLRSIGLRPEDVLGRYPHQLSGGERQRLLIARILLIKPKLVVADEPVSMVDVSVKATILNHLRELKDKYGASVLYITHEIPTAYYIADEAIVLFYGYVVERAPMGELVEKPLHPYTQELIKLMPNPDPNSRKSLNEYLATLDKIAKAAEAGRPSKGCPYQNRCPFVMPKCRENLPPLIQVNDKHYVRCFLYT
jgi:peptide/nickel transport system ATP-binding protein